MSKVLHLLHITLVFLLATGVGAAEGVWLRGYRTDEDFGAADREVIFGRHIKSTDRKDFVSLTSPTYEGANAPPIIPYVVAEKVTYNDVPSWPTEPDGLGPSLERIDPNAYSNDAVNWASSASAAVDTSISVV